MGFVTKSEIDLSVFLKSANEMVGDEERYKITFSHDDKIQFGEVLVNFSHTIC